jgi:2-dehydropantoate 2-reductase
MQNAVIGAGYRVCVYAGNLARVGEQVTPIDVWEEHVRQIRAHGPRMDGLHGEFTATVGATADPAEAPKADAAVICVNTYNTPDAAQAARVVLKDTGYALRLQNGVGNVEILTEVLGAGRVMAGLSFHSGDLKAPSHVTHTNQGPTYLGELDRSRSARPRAVSSRPNLPPSASRRRHTSWRRRAGFSARPAGASTKGRFGASWVTPGPSRIRGSQSSLIHPDR